jgi:hypothetical protein
MRGIGVFITACCQLRGRKPVEKSAISISGSSGVNLTEDRYRGISSGLARLPPPHLNSAAIRMDARYHLMLHSL